MTEDPTPAASETGSPTDSVEADYRAVEYEIGLFFRRLRSIGAGLARDVHPDLEPGGYALLVRVAEAEGERSSDLAGYFNVGKPTISRQLHTLEALGLLQREPDPADGRAQLLSLTSEGRARLERMREARQTRLREVLKPWGADEVRTLARMLGRLNGLAEQLATGSPGVPRARPGSDPAAPEEHPQVPHPRERLPAAEEPRPQAQPRTRE